MTETPIEWRKPGRCSSCSLLKADFGEIPEIYGHCKRYPRSGSRQSSDFACDQYSPMEGFAKLTRSADHDRNFTDPKFMASKAKPAKPTRRKRTTKAATSRASSRDAKVVADYESAWRQRLGSRTLDDAKKYRVTEAYDLDDLIDHSKYDLGIVIEKLEGSKVKVAFKNGERVLITCYGQ